MLDNHALRKKKYIRGNDKPFINKRLTKEIMRRTRFSNNFFENPTDEKIKTGIFIQNNVIYVYHF